MSKSKRREYFVVNCFTALISSSRCSRHSPGTIKHMPPLTHHTNRAHAEQQNHTRHTRGPEASFRACARSRRSMDAPLPDSPTCVGRERGAYESGTNMVGQREHLAPLQREAERHPHVVVSIISEVGGPTASDASPAWSSWAAARQCASPRRLASLPT